LAATVTKKGYTMFIVGTSEADILQVLVDECYPKPIAMTYGDSTYRIIAIVR
jgi:hypothetical protein